MTDTTVVVVVMQLELLVSCFFSLARRGPDSRKQKEKVEALRCVVKVRRLLSPRHAYSLTHTHTRSARRCKHTHIDVHSLSLSLIYIHTHTHQSGEEQRSGPDGASMCLQRRELLGYSRHLFWRWW